MSIAARHISLSYTTRNGSVQALENTSFEVRAQEFLCIVGPSGCGKTTLLKIMAGLLQPTSGRLEFDSTPNGAPPRNALVFQEHGLFPWMSVLDNVGLGLEMRGVSRSSRRAEAMQFVERFGLSAFAHSYPHELSVGMRQRVSLARAFMMDPDVLLMDEPFASLDALSKAILQEELLRIWRDHKKQVVYVTHDIEEALLLGDRVLVMSGRPASVLEDVSVPLPRPRNLQDRGRPEIIERKNHIWRVLEREVRSSIGGIT